jgi:hypothetical protein
MHIESFQSFLPLFENHSDGKIHWELQTIKERMKELEDRGEDISQSSAWRDKED